MASPLDNQALAHRARVMHARVTGKGYTRLAEGELHRGETRMTVQEFLDSGLLPGRFVLLAEDTDVTVEAQPGGGWQKVGGFIGKGSGPVAVIWRLPELK